MEFTVRKNDWRNKCPDIDSHTKPAGNYANPYRSHIGDHIKIQVVGAKNDALIHTIHTT